MRQDEQSLRVNLAAMYRVFDHMGWSELIYNHITVKLPGADEMFLINPYGLHYNEVTASNLVKVDIEGNKLQDTDSLVNPAGMLIHSAIHEAREDVHCIAHIHSTEGMAVACLQDGLRIDNFYSVLLHKQVAYHDFEGITVMPSEKEKLVANLGDKDFLILRNHGLLVCGKSIPETFMNMWALQRACEIQVAADSCGEAMIPVAEEIGEKSEQLLAMQMQASGYGELEFAAMVRQIDRLDDSYKN